MLSIKFCPLRQSFDQSKEILLEVFEERGKARMIDLIKEAKFQKIYLSH